MCESFRSFPQGLNFWGKCEMSSEVKARVPTRSSVKGANKHEVSVTGWGHQLCWLNMSLQRCTLTTLSVHSKICPSFTTQLAHAPPVGRAPCLLCHRCLAMSTPIQGCSLPLEHVPCKCLSVEPPVADAIERVTGAGAVEAPGGAPESHQLVRGDT